MKPSGKRAFYRWAGAAKRIIWWERAVCGECGVERDDLGAEAGRPRDLARGQAEILHAEAAIILLALACYTPCPGCGTVDPKALAVDLDTTMIMTVGWATWGTTRTRIDGEVTTEPIDLRSHGLTGLFGSKL